MAIENLELNNQDEGNSNVPALVPIEVTLRPNNTLIAGTQKISHPLINNVMTLYGFIGEISNKNIFEEFDVNGMSIQFPRRENNDFIKHDTYKIYPKILIDLKQKRFYDLFPQLKDIEYSHKDQAGGHKCWSENDPHLKKNYYFFKSNYDTNPAVCSNELYLVCKYKEDGKFKYRLFAPHEVIIEQL